MNVAGAAGNAAENTGGEDGGDVGPNDTIPAGWTGAQTLLIQQALCVSGAPTTFDVTSTGDAIEGTLTCAEFREFQSLCGYVLDRGATTRVLVQPCDLHPTNVPKGDLAYNVTFTLPARADRTAVEVYRRFDFYGAATPPSPMLLGTAVVGAPTDDAGAEDGGVD